MAETPELIGKYRITQLIAHGGMGSVYKAVHPTLNRNVILKKLTIRGKPQFIERFKREARIMMDFKHDNIVTVYDHFKEGNSYYIVLEYVDGFSLEELIRRERALPSALAMSIFLEVSKALKYAHDNGVIHRDIKPANILISKKGEVKLVDFGIAGYETEGQPADEGLTTQGMTLGTVSYMPPEQFENTKTVDKVADIYAMGVMLYEMVTGKKPFPGTFSPDTLMLIKRGKYVHVRKMNPKIDPVIATLTGKMIRPKKEQRYKDLAPVIRILDKRLRGEDPTELQKRLVASMNGIAYTPPKRRVRKLARRVFGLGLPCLLLAAAAGGWLYSTGRWFEWFFPTEYGILTIEVPFAPGQNTAGHPVIASIQSEDGTEGKPVSIMMPSPLTMAANWLGLGHQGVVSSDRLHLPPGSYRLKLAVSQQAWSETFYLQPYVVQKSEGRQQGMVLSYPYNLAQARPLSLEVKALDGRMRNEIGALARVSLKGRSDQWIPLESFSKDALVSGRAYEVRVAASGFYSRVFQLDVDPLETDLHVQVTLVPQEGTLRVTSDVDGLVLSINGHESVLTGGLKPVLRTLRIDKKSLLFLPLAPGPLRLGAAAGNRRGSLDLEIVSDATLKLAVSAGPSSEELLIKEIP